jgi:hypothetical protein
LLSFPSCLDYFVGSEQSILLVVATQRAASHLLRRAVSDNPHVYATILVLEFVPIKDVLKSRNGTISESLSGPLVPG